MTKGNSTVLKASGLYKAFKQGTTDIVILDNAHIELKAGEIVALVGPSGCGKTTCMQILGLLDAPDKGQISINGVDYSNSRDYHKTLCRRNNIGFVYQAYNLLADFTALENVRLPLLLQDKSRKEANNRSITLLEELGLKERINHLPIHLSGGEQQRVAIARSLIHDPSLILTDEPTGNLDHDTAQKTVSILFNAAKSFNKSLIIVTHNNDIAKQADRILTIEDGKFKTL